jgi:hypothetical protein
VLSEGRSSSHSKIQNPKSSFVNPLFSSQMKNLNTAAHLIPFSKSKNHHGAMDRNLIAPCPDHHWHVAKILDPRRSNGERELIELSGKSLLLPKDPAFHPDEGGLKCRCERLSA